MQITLLGDSALVLRFNDAPQSDAAVQRARHAISAIRMAGLRGLIDLLPAYNSLTIFFDLKTWVRSDAAADDPLAGLKREIVAALSRGATAPAITPAPTTVSIPTCYDREFAPDLAELASRVHLSVDDVVRLHAGADYRVSCIGFAPGFPYLSGLPQQLAMPRRVTPRTNVLAGSVAIGGAQTGVYPRDSPGGWNVIGRTPLRLFDVQRDPSCLFSIGDAVRFRIITRAAFDELSK